MAEVHRQRAQVSAISSSSRAKSRRATGRMLVFTLAWAGALLHGLLLWRAGSITLGQVVAFMGLIGTLRFPTFISIFTFNLVQLGLASARRILEMINTETELDENPQRRGAARSAAR